MKLSLNPKQIAITWGAGCIKSNLPSGGIGI